MTIEPMTIEPIEPMTIEPMIIEPKEPIVRVRFLFVVQLLLVRVRGCGWG